jgi:hypothetical protein
MPRAMTICASNPICQTFMPSDIHGLSIVSAFDSLDRKPHNGTLVPLLLFCVCWHRSFQNMGRPVKTSTLAAACAGLVVAWTVAVVAGGRRVCPSRKIGLEGMAP